MTFFLFWDADLISTGSGDDQKKNIEIYFKATGTTPQAPSGQSPVTCSTTTIGEEPEGRHQRYKNLESRGELEVGGKREAGGWKLGSPNLLLIFLCNSPR